MMTTAERGAQGANDRELWERERLLESLEAYRRGLVDAPLVQKFAVSRAVSPNESRPLTVVASEESEDRLGDVVRADGWDLQAYRRNPVFLWAHDYTRTPIGRSAWVGVEGPRLTATLEFAPTDFAREVETLYRQRFLRAVSVGFRARAFSFAGVERGARAGESARAGEGAGRRAERAEAAASVHIRRSGGASRPRGRGARAERVAAPAPDGRVTRTE